MLTFERPTLVVTLSKIFAETSADRVGLRIFLDSAYRLCFLRMTHRAVIAFCEWPISRAKDPSGEARGEKAVMFSCCYELFSCAPRTASLQRLTLRKPRWLRPPRRRRAGARFPASPPIP